MTLARDLQAGRVEANGISIAYLEAGPPDPDADRGTIVFLHGGTGTAERHWAMQLRDFGSRGYRCLAPDHRGHGGTSNDRDGLDQELMAGDVSAFLTAVGAERAHLVGFSIGGVIGLYLAMAHPEQLASLTTIGSHMTIDEHVLASNATIEPSRIQAEDPDWAAELREMHSAIYGPGHWRTLCRWLMDTWGRQPEWTDADMQRVLTPSRVGRGQSDDRVVQSQVDRMVRALPNARRFVVPGVGHYFHSVRPGSEALGRVMLELYDATRLGVRLFG